MPQRFLKPGIVSSKKWDGLSWIGQSFYVRILTLVDDFGRYEADPILLKNQAFPLRENIRAAQVLELCRELSLSQLAFFYKADGKEYFQLSNWTERARADKSKYPETGEPYLTANVVSVTANVVNPQPPTSPSSPTPSPPPESSPPPPPSATNVVEAHVNFPRSEEEAVNRAPLRFQEQEQFVIDTWHKANGRGGRDAKEVLIRHWGSHLAIEWKYRQEREQQVSNAGHKPNPSGATPIWQQIKSTEALLAEVEKRLSALPLPNGGLYPEQLEAMRKKRAPLVEQKKRLNAALIELHRQAAPGSSAKTKYAYYRATRAAS
jgi:hypothetical protein